MEETEITNARRELLVAQRGTLFTLKHDGLIDDEVFEALAAEIDEKIDSLENGY